MASNCNNKAAAWTALKWLAGAPAAETYYFQAAGRVPVTTGSWRKVPGLAALPDAKVIVGGVVEELAAVERGRRGRRQKRIAREQRPFFVVDRVVNAIELVRAQQDVSGNALIEAALTGGNRVR